MKISRYAVIAAITFMAAACDEGIDPISRVAPGPDEAAPTVAIKYPSQGTLIRVKEDVAPVNIELEVIDDIEIQSISVKLDETQIKEFTSFRDYRRVLESYEYKSLTNGIHTLSVTAKDLSGKTTTESVTFEKVAPYQPVYAGEIFYMPFDGDYLELVSIQNATKVGTPTFSADAADGPKSYQGAKDSYLTFATEGLLSQEFSAAFWYKLNAVPDRAGILTIGPQDPKSTTVQNNRKSGFRLFRENAGGKQRVKLNVGNGAADNWFDGGVAADIDPALPIWHHIAFTISTDKVAVYIDGIPVSQGSFPGVGWTGCDILSIASGAPRFTEWGHHSDLSMIDELRLFNKALTQQEVLALMN